MTPRAVSSLLLDRVPIKPGDRVLDPAVGTGELLNAARIRVPDAIYEGWDIDPTVLKYATQADSIIYSEKDCLTIDATPEYDVIIANPPYFEFKLDDLQKAKFKPVIGGRVNIFTLFFYQAMNLLKDGGHMGFIVPPSMDNGAYFKNLRKFLLSQAELVDLYVIHKSDHFIDAQTSAQIIVFRKTTSSTKDSKFVFTSVDKSNNTENSIFTTDVDYLEKAWDGKKSLWDLGYSVATGCIAWNQYKGQFVTKENGVPIIYAKDIKVDGTISAHPNFSERRYLPRSVHPGSIKSGAIVVNRITGAVGSGILRAALVDDGEFFGENHVNVITARQGVEQVVDLPELLTKIASVDATYLSLLTGNTQISAKELAHHIPF